MNFNSSHRRQALLFGLAFTAWIFAAPSPALAINVHAVYRSACDRDLGIIIDVEKRDLTLLRLDGSVIDIPRYEVASIAYYPVSGVDIDPEQIQRTHPAMRIRTLLNGELVPLLTGWPVDFNEERIAFVNLEGQEVIVNRERIWSLEYLEQLPRRQKRRVRQTEQLHFVHPHAVGFCNQHNSAPLGRSLFPQQFINDQVVIKRELDRLMEGHQDVRDYERDQVFYPKPQIYHNETALGLWTSHGEKHGATAGRPNNFTPVLYDELSLGPFGYQHRLVTGAAPMPYSLHTEVQTQIYYRFKAAYFHASAMFDPNLILVGDEYEWTPDDLAADRPDARIVEPLMVELGFDYGPLALQISPGAIGMEAARNSNAFATEEHALFRFGPRLTFLTWEAELLVGLSDGDGVPIRWARLNGQLDLDENWGFNVSLLVRRLKMSIDDDSGAVFQIWQVSDEAVAAVVQAHYRILRRYDVAARLSVESSNSKATTDTGLQNDGSALAVTGAWFVGLRF